MGLKYTEQSQIERSCTLWNTITPWSIYEKKSTIIQVPHQATAIVLNDKAIKHNTVLSYD